MAYFRTDWHIYLVVFKHTTSKFICTSALGVVKCLKEQDRHRALKYIKEYNPTKEKFVRINKKSLKERLIWCAETTDYLSDHYYFK